MKIFNNFDTEFCKRAFSKKKEQFGEDKVFCIKRSKYYWYFNGLIPFLILTFIVVGIGFLLLKYKLNIYFLYGLLFVYFILSWKIIFHKFLRYKMDFTIVSPKGIFSYKQKGLLNSSIKEISSNKIKTIEISNDTLLGNIFKYGSINIISDGAEIEASNNKETVGMIKLVYVDSHFQVKEKITKICFQ